MRYWFSASSFAHRDSSTFSESRGDIITADDKFYIQEYYSEFVPHFVNCWRFVPTFTLEKLHLPLKMLFF